VQSGHEKENWGNKLYKGRLTKDGAIVELTVHKSSARAVVTRGPKSVKLRISTVRSRCQGTAGEDTAGCKKV
jgi:hypothetical protein